MLIPQRLKIILDRKLTVANLLDKAADARPDQLVFKSDEDLSHYGVNETGLTTDGLRQLVNRLSNLLIANGLEQFDRLGIWKENSLDYVFHFWAAMRLGGIAVPVNGGMPANDLVGYLAHCNVRALVTDIEGLERLSANVSDLPTSLETIFVTNANITDTFPALPSCRVVTLPDILFDASPDFTPPYMNHDQDVLICHTSGTTGFPKGVLHCSQSLIIALKGALRVQWITNRNIAMTASWMNHHIALSGALTSVAAGMLVHTMVNHDAETLLRGIETHRPNVFFAFPDIFQRMCRSGLDKYDLSSIRMWMTGGDAMHEVFIRQLVRQGNFFGLLRFLLPGSFFCELLGTSEVGMVALMKISTMRTRRYGRCVGRRTVVSPKVKIADEVGNEVKAGDVGRLMVKGPSVFKGYWNQHDRLHGVVRDGWWWTGDVAFRDTSGRVYQIDREVDVIQTKSSPIYCLLVEEEALKLDGVIEAAVVPINSGSELRAALVLQIEPDSVFDVKKSLSTLNNANEFCAGIEHIEVVRSDADIPRGLTGKVLKRRLRERYRYQNAV